MKREKLTEEGHLMTLVTLDLLQQALPEDHPTIRTYQIRCFLEALSLGHMRPEDLKELAK